MILSNFPQKLFWKPLQRLKLTMGRKSALLTRHLGRREVIRPKGNRTCPRNRGNYCYYHRDGEHDRFGLAEKGLPIYRKSSTSGEPVSRGDPPYDDGLHSWRDCNPSFSPSGFGLIFGDA